MKQPKSWESSKDPSTGEQDRCGVFPQCNAMEKGSGPTSAAHNTVSHDRDVEEDREAPSRVIPPTLSLDSSSCPCGVRSQDRVTQVHPGMGAGPKEGMWGPGKVLVFHLGAGSWGVFAS